MSKGGGPNHHHHHQQHRHHHGHHHHHHHRRNHHLHHYKTIRGELKAFPQIRQSGEKAGPRSHGGVGGHQAFHADKILKYKFGGRTECNFLWRLLKVFFLQSREIVI